MISQPWVPWASCSRGPNIAILTPVSVTALSTTQTTKLHRVQSSEDFSKAQPVSLCCQNRDSLEAFLGPSMLLLKWTSMPVCLLNPQGFWSTPGALVCPKSPCRIVAGYSQTRNLVLLGRTPWTYWKQLYWYRLCASIFKQSAGNQGLKSLWRTEFRPLCEVQTAVWRDSDGVCQTEH